jgi:hypothetical protein
MKGESKVTLPKAYCISLPQDTLLWTCIVFTRGLSRLHVSFCLQWMAKVSNMSAPSFAWSFWRTFFRLVRCQLKMTFRATKHQQNDKVLKKSKTHPWRPSVNNPWAHRHCWDQLWSLPGDLNRKFDYVLHCSFITTVHPPTSLKTRVCD